MGKKNFKIGSFNLYNLSLPGVEYYPKQKYTREEYGKKIEWIASRLEEMDADIVGFQEVFYEEALNDAVKAVRLFEGGTMVVGRPPSREPGNGSGPMVGCVCRFPVIEQEVIENFPDNSAITVETTGANGTEKIIRLPYTRFSRPVLRITTRLFDEIEAMVFVVHLKSKRPIYLAGEDEDDPVVKAKGQARSLMLRTAEATGLRSILMHYMKGTQLPVFVLGDVNDAGLAVSTRIISGEPPWRRLATDERKKIWDTLLYLAKDIQARQSSRDVYYSHIYNGYYESLDHIMVSNEFVRQNPDRLGKVVYVSAFNDHLVDETLSPDEVEKWQSDHGQVVACVELNE